MTDRSDIEPNKNNWRRLSYTRRCGWVDWGHALPTGPAKLKSMMDKEKSPVAMLNEVDIRLDGDPAYILSYGQAMGAGPVRVSTERHWIVKKGLSKADKEKAALAIFIEASHQFENVQGSLFPFSLKTASSSYSPEDLVSNLIGFYSAFRNISPKTMRETCGEVSVEESYRIWDNFLPDGFSGLKNPTTRPILFPTNETPNGVSDINFPTLLSTIRPAPKGTSWVKLRDNRFVDGSLISSGHPLDVSSTGVLTIRQTVME